MTGAVRAWTDLKGLVPDLTRVGAGGMCEDKHPSPATPYVCTRGEGHTGRHAAGTGTYIVAVWADGSHGGIS